MSIHKVEREAVVKDQSPTTNSRLTSVSGLSMDDDADQEKNVDKRGNNLLGLHSHTFLSPELRQLRKKYFAIVSRVTILAVIAMWACLPAYWGALASSAKLTRNLDAWFIDRDDSLIGNVLWKSFGNTSYPAQQLGWTKMDPFAVGSNEEVVQAVIEEKAWIAVVVQANATSNLLRARENGDSTYEPSSAITVYYSQARNEIATGNYIMPITTNLLQGTTSAYATYSAQLYLAGIKSDGTINATALQLLADAPQTIAPAVSWITINLRPYTAPVATAVTLVGPIFICIFAFLTTMANAGARALVQQHLRFSSYLGLRITVPFIMYFPLSLSYSLLNLAFKLPFGVKYSYASGFFLFFIYIYLAMAGLGLALESMITILTPRFVPFFLFALIVYNVSAAVLPKELQISFYSYGDGFPIWNLSQAVRTIIFDTHSHLGTNVIVLIGWILLSCGTLSGFTWLTRRLEKVPTKETTDRESQ